MGKTYLECILSFTECSDEGSKKECEYSLFCDTNTNKGR